MIGRLARLEAIAEPARVPARRRAIRMAGLVVLAVLAVLALRHVDLREVASVLRRADPALALAACGANLLSLFSHSHRWAAVVRPQGGRVRSLDAFSAVVAGFAAGVVLPARAGDVIRSAILARRSGLTTTSVVAAAALDYVIGTAALVPLLAVFGLATPLPAWAHHALLALAAVSIVGGGVAFLLRPSRHGRAAAHRRQGAAAGLVARFRAGLAAAHAPSAVATAFSWGLAGWVAEVLIAWFALASLGLPGGVVAAGIAVLASTAANVVAISPGNTGPFELAVVVALGGLGISREPALAYALLYHLVHLIPVSILGGVVLVREARQEGGESKGARTEERDALPGP